MEVISDAAFDVTFVLLAPATVPLTEIVSDRSLFCTGSTSTVFTAIATCLVALCMDIPIQTTRTATITSTTISTFFFCPSEKLSIGFSNCVLSKSSFRSSVRRRL